VGRKSLALLTTSEDACGSGVNLTPALYFFIITFTGEEVGNIYCFCRFINKINDFNGFSFGVIIEDEAVFPVQKP
jgi:hypothetical protein